MTNKEYAGLKCARDLAVIYVAGHEADKEIISTLDYLLEAVDELRGDLTKANRKIKSSDDFLMELSHDEERRDYYLRKPRRLQERMSK